MSDLTLRELRTLRAKMGSPPTELAVLVGSDALEDMRNLPNFTPAESYRSMKAQPDELGMVEVFRFFGSADAGWSVSMGKIL